MRNHETIIQRKLEELDTEICSNQNRDGDILMEFENLKNELTEIYSVKGKEAMFRSRTRWIENGEKPTKYFFNFSGKTNYEKKDYNPPQNNRWRNYLEYDSDKRENIKLLKTFPDLQNVAERN